MFLLDTNAIIAVLNDRVPALSQRLDAEIERGGRILLSTIVLHELRFGIARSSRRAHSERLLAAFLDIRGYLADRGQPIGPYDSLIAAQARRHEAVLVTRNRREFERVPGLMVADWTI